MLEREEFDKWLDGLQSYRDIYSLAKNGNTHTRPLNHIHDGKVDIKAINTRVAFLIEEVIINLFLVKIDSDYYVYLQQESLGKFLDGLAEIMIPIKLQDFDKYYSLVPMKLKLKIDSATFTISCID